MDFQNSRRVKLIGRAHEKVGNREVVMAADLVDLPIGKSRFAWVSRSAIYVESVVEISVASDVF